ncbi:nucleotide sugar dehydrogenase [Streptomyces clavifer]|uniref:nucleotide sugar dehydrogenase n=1 Tax=Streptomyces clavifer TaxID=68188 RepID=UPI0036A97872
MNNESVVVLGQGYVGLPLALRAAEVGYQVVGLEIDELRAKRLSDGDSFVEDIPSQRLAAVIKSGNYRASTDFADAAGFDYCVITVPTPLKDGAPDLSYILDASHSIAPYLRPGATVVLESTTYPGTTTDVLKPLLETGSGLHAGEDFHIGYSPERIDPSNPVWHLENTPKVVAGIDERSLDRVDAFYSSLVERTVRVSSPTVAELSKLLENTFRYVNIALVNELAMFSNQLGTDIWEVIGAASSKPFGFMSFSPGPGVGGHCLPIDPSYLSWQIKRDLRHDFRFISLANDINDHMPDHVVMRLSRGLNSRRKALNGSRILLLGLAYKRDTGDIRESPALAIAEGLQRLGASVLAVEPHLDSQLAPPGIPCVALTEEEVGSADAVVLVADHTDFDYGMITRCASYVFDTRGRLNGDNVEQL